MAIGNRGRVVRRSIDKGRASGERPAAPANGGSSTTVAIVCGGRYVGSNCDLLGEHAAGRAAGTEWAAVAAHNNCIAAVANAPASARKAPAGRSASARGLAHSAAVIAAKPRITLAATNNTTLPSPAEGRRGALATAAAEAARPAAEVAGGGGQRHKAMRANVNVVDVCREGNAKAGDTPTTVSSSTRPLQRGKLCQR